MRYIPDRLAYVRRRSVEIRIGEVRIGGDRPVLVQSMCTTPTQDVAATVAQSVLLAQAGCELVRVTAPGPKDAAALKDIRAGFTAAGFGHIPLCADIHFMPAAALEAVEHVEKVRVNPGNFADKKRFAAHAYTDAEYAAEVARVAERFQPLVRRAKALGKALRIGTNHGSLSDRIMNWHGDSPAGMVESALEFVRVCVAEGCHDVVISMKASNPKVMVAAYRLLVARLDAEGLPPFPLHLGVTEAGDGEDGRIKSAAGIGALLEDGLGDTVRVSLTEPPECEIPVARALVARYAPWRRRAAPADAPGEDVDPYSYRRRTAEIVRVAGAPLGGGLLPRVFVPADWKGAGTPPPDARVDDAVLWPLLAHAIPGAERPRAPSVRSPAPADLALTHVKPGDPLAAVPPGLVLLRLDDDAPAAFLRRTLPLLPDGCLIGIAEPGLMGETRAYRLLAAVIEDQFLHAERARVGSGRRQPICLALPFQHDDLALAAIAGGLLIDGIGDALYLPRARDARALAFTILQAVKARITRADYVACPSCGRTQFDLIAVTAHIKEVTNHLDGVAIAIMGCIVNGPGEMADADFGFVGSGPGKIDLYRGKEVVRRNLPFAGARDELVALIKESGKWREPAIAPCPSVRTSERPNGG